MKYTESSTKVHLNAQNEEEKKEYNYDYEYESKHENEHDEDDIEKIDEFQTNEIHDENENDYFSMNESSTNIDYSFKKIDEQKYISQEPIKIHEIEDDNQTQIESNYHLFYPYSEFNKLNKKCRKIIEEAENDSMKQFEVSKSLLEGENQFPINIELGKQYLNKSLKNKCIESIIYTVKLLIKGNIIQQDLTKAKRILHNNHHIIDSRLFVLKGKISKKKKRNMLILMRTLFD